MEVYCYSTSSLIQKIGVPGNEATVPSVFQSSNLIGWVRMINLGYCYGNGAYVHIVMYNILTNRVEALKSTSE